MAKKQQFHSEEVQEIMGRIPSRIIRRGTEMVFLTFAIILLGTYFIKYPERVQGTISITTLNAPVAVVAKMSSPIEEIEIVNCQKVNQGDALAVLLSNAAWRDVLTLEKELENLETDNFVTLQPKRKNYKLGDLQAYYSAYYDAVELYNDFVMRDAYTKKIKYVEKQIAKQKEYIRRLSAQKKQLVTELDYTKKRCASDKKLLKNKAISAIEYEESEKAVLGAEKNLSVFNAQQSVAELSLIQLENQKNELTLSKEEDMLQHSQRITTTKAELAAQIAKWKQTYLLTAPISGEASFTRKWDVGQQITAGDIFLTVVPKEDPVFWGIIKVPQEGFGKIKIGQKVNIRLKGYPYMQYGVLEGEIDYLSSVPEETQDGNTYYTVQICFPNGMTTTYRKEIMLVQKMEGTAEIITEDKRLIERFIDPVIALFTNGI